MAEKLEDRKLTLIVVRLCDKRLLRNKQTKTKNG